MLGAFLLLAAPSALAQDHSLAARSAMRILGDAEAQLTSAASAKDRVAALTGAINAYETGLSALRDGLRQLVIQETALSRRLASDEAELARLLGVLAMIEQTPDTLLALHPSGPLDTVRAGMVLAEISPALQREALALRQKLEEIRSLRRLQMAAMDQLGLGLSDLQRARTELSLAMAERKDLPDGAEERAAAVLRLAEAAQTLDAFAAGLEALPAAGIDLTADPGLPPLLPLQGRLLRGYGEPDAAGISRPGWLFAAEPQALVSSPAAATIRYLGPLLDYGKVMILEPQAGTLVVLAGLGEVYGSVGQVVAAGDPIGLMGGTPPAQEVFLAADPGAAEWAEATAGRAGYRSETLYLEVRRNGRTMDPGTWFEGTKDAD